VKKSSSYRETFRQHRKLLILPVILTVFIAAWFVFGAQKSYQSSVSLWVDNPAPSDSSLGNLNPAETAPSQQEQQVVQELLATPSFAIAVGHHSSLASYLASNPGGGMSPTALLKKLSGPGSLDDQIVAALGPKAVSTTTPGPQVLQISFNGPTPAVAQSALNALVTELQRDSSQFSQQHNEQALSYYKAQVQSAEQSLNSTRAEANQYLEQHPNASTSDPNLTALTAAEGAASTQLTQANSNLSAAASAVKGIGNGSDVQVIDPATMPTSPLSGKKKQIEELLAGLFAGLLLSFLGTIALTRGKSDPWEDELEQSFAALDRPARQFRSLEDKLAGTARSTGTGSRSRFDTEAAIGDISGS
jgi:uncharacterized protein involved in exopolysaccharide biosynthesis